MITPRDLADAIMRGDAANSVKIARELLNQGTDIKKVIEEGTTKALQALDIKCTNEEFNLLEILLAGRAMMHVMEIIVENYPDIQGMEVGPKIVLGTILGDIHDFGKNVVHQIFKAAGFRVIDLGIDVEPQKFVDAAKEQGAAFIGVSSLIATTVPFIRVIKSLALQAELSGVKIIAGGAALKQSSPGYLNVDAVAETVFEGLEYCREVSSHDSP